MSFSEQLFHYCIAIVAVILTLAILNIIPLHFGVRLETSVSLTVPIEKDAEWQPVFGSKHTFLVYSAYVESRKGSTAIRLIGAAPMVQDEKFYCRFWYEDKPEPYIETNELIEAEKESINENWGREFSAYFFYCPLRDASVIPSSVSLYSVDNNNVSSFSGNLDKLPKILVQNRLENQRTVQQGAPKLAACIPPIFNYSRPWTLIEWIEVNRLLGYSHFHFYNYSTYKNVSCILNKYVKQGLVTVLDWHTNQQKYLMLDTHERLIRVMNLFAGMNDCLYRGMYKFRYLAFLDVDELLVPQENITLLALIGRLESANNNTASFVMKNSFYFTLWPDDEAYDGPDLITQRKTKRKETFESHSMRSKYVVRPEMVEEVGNHNIYRTVQNFKSDVGVDEKEASNRHYRFCDFGPEYCNATTKQDRRMWDFQQQLIERVNEVQRTFGVECELEPLKMVKH